MANQESHLRTVTHLDGAVILDTRLGKLVRLNPTGAPVWEALCRGEEIREIAAKLALETGEQIQTLDDDLRTFVDELRMQELVQG